jgi:hypothetical protein
MHTLVTPPGDTACVYDYSHSKVRDTVPVVLTVDEDPGWLWVRHGDTISNARDPRHWRRRIIHQPALFPVDWRAVQAAWR